MEQWVAAQWQMFLSVCVFQIAHRFHQLMKLFKKQEKMDTWSFLCVCWTVFTHRFAPLPDVWSDAHLSTAAWSLVLTGTRRTSGTVITSSETIWFGSVLSLRIRKCWAHSDDDDDGTSGERSQLFLAVTTVHGYYWCLPPTEELVQDLCSPAVFDLVCFSETLSRPYFILWTAGNSSTAVGLQIISHFCWHFSSPKLTGLSLGTTKYFLLINHFGSLYSVWNSLMFVKEQVFDGDPPEQDGT